MTTVKLKFRPSTIEGKEGSLFLQLIHGRAVKQINLDCHIMASEWDDKQEMIVLDSSNPTRISQLLLVKDRVMFEIHKVKHTIKLLSKKNTYLLDDVIALYREVGNYQITLFQFIHKQSEKLMRLNRIRTAETYLATMNSFSRFHNGQDVFFDMIDADMMERYEAYMKSRGLKRNTTSYYMRILRSIYNKAVEEGITNQTMPFNSVYTGIEKTIKRAITFEDIQKIKNLDLSGNPSLDMPRDMFILSYLFRGMSFIDMAYLKKTDIKDGCLNYIRKKTGQPLSIKWIDAMENILIKYRDTTTTQYLLPIVKVEDGSERKQYKNAMLLVNRKLKKIAKMAGVDANISMYVARHSWASVASSMNIPIGIISGGMGHDSEQTTQIYLASISSAKIDDANDEITKGL